MSAPIHVDGTDFPSFSAAAKHYGIPYTTAYRRYTQDGWTIRQALGLDAPPMPNKCVVDGKTFPSPAAAAKHYGVPPSTFQRRITYDKWTLRQALGLDAPPRRSGHGKRQQDVAIRTMHQTPPEQEPQFLYVTEASVEDNGHIAVTHRTYTIINRDDDTLHLTDPVMTSVPVAWLDSVEPDGDVWRWRHMSFANDRKGARSLVLRRALADIRAEQRLLAKRESRLVNMLADLHDS